MKLLKGVEEQEAVRWFTEASERAKEALCLRAKCGTVIVKDGEVIGQGYNAPPQNNSSYRTCLNEYELPKNYRYDHTCCIHAEWRAIMNALRDNPNKVKDSKLYFCRVDDEGNPKRSRKPYCTVCSRLALDVGIAEFLLWQQEGPAAFPTDEYDQLSFQNIKD